MTPESKAKADVTRSLGSLMSQGDVFWWTRLQSGMFTMDGNFCHCSEKGTFDLVAVFKGHKKDLQLAFIEVKRADKPADLSDTQKAFKAKYSGKHPSIHFWLVQSGKQVVELVRKYGYDRMQDVEM